MNRIPMVIGKLQEEMLWASCLGQILLEPFRMDDQKSNRVSFQGSLR